MCACSMRCRHAHESFQNLSSSRPPLPMCSKSSAARPSICKQSWIHWLSQRCACARRILAFSEPAKVKSILSPQPIGSHSSNVIASTDIPPNRIGAHYSDERFWRGVRFTYPMSSPIPSTITPGYEIYKIWSRFVPDLLYRCCGRELLLESSRYSV